MVDVLRKMKRKYQFTDYLVNIEKKWNPNVIKKVGEPIDTYVGTINRDGILVIPDFFTPEELVILQEETAKLVNDIDNTRHTYQDKSFRIYDCDNYSESIKNIYSQNELFNKVLEVYYGKPVDLKSTVYQESHPSDINRFERGYGLSGFHFDKIRRSLKAFIYLDDVEIKNGPFTYIFGSNDIASFNKLEKMKKQYVEGGETAEGSYDHTYYSGNEEKEYQLWEQATPMVAKAGSVILAETRGLHAAAEITEGVRKVLINYYQ